MAEAANLVHGLSPPTRRVVRLIFPALTATASMGSAALRFPLPANGINSSLGAVAAALTWFAAHWMVRSRGAGVVNIGTPADKLPDNGSGTTASPRAEQTRAEQI